MRILLATCWTLLGLSTPLIAQVPSISKLTPQGVTSGTTTTVKVAGANLENPKAFQISSMASEAVKLTPETEVKANELTCDFTVPANVPNGIHTFRVLTDKGISQPALVVIDSLPTIAHANQNKSRESAQSIPGVCAVEGHVDNLSRLYFRFPGKANQPFSLEVQARRLGSPLDPIVRLFDPNGREIAWSDDEPGLQGDCFLNTTLPADGEYTIELTDIRYQGSGNHRFRLRIGNFAVINTFYPLVLERKAGASFSVASSTLSAPFSAELSAESLAVLPSHSPSQLDWAIPIPANPIDQPELKAALWPAVGLSAAPQVAETEPNNTAEQSQRVELGHGLNGRSDQPGDIDRFVFTAKKDQKFTFDAITRSAGSPTDLTMRVLKPDGGQLAAAEDNGLTDGRMDVTFPADGDYTLEVRDLHERGGPHMAWHVSVTENKPSFTLTAAEDTFNIPAGGTIAVQVNAQRKGYGGPIQVAIDNLPEGLTSHPTVIGPGRNDAILTVKSTPDAKVETIQQPRILGTANVNGETVTAVASLHDHLKASMSNAPWPSRNLIYSFAASVTTPAPVNLRFEPAEVVFGQNLSAKVKVIAERTEGWDGDIALAINPAKNGIPGNITFAPQPIKKGTNEVELTIAANEKAALGEFTIGLNGTIKKDKATSVQAAPGLTIKLQAPMTIAVEPAGGSIAKGGELKFKVAITRNPALAGEIVLTAVNLPAGVTADAVTIPADQSEAEFLLKATAEAATANINNLNLKADAKVGDKTLSVSSQNLPLKVE